MTRPLQFKLRTLLLFALVGGPLAGWVGKGYEAYRQELRTRKLIVPESISFYGPQLQPQPFSDWPNEGAPQVLPPADAE